MLAGEGRESGVSGKPPRHTTGPVAEESWWATGLQAVESGSKTRQKHGGSLGLYKGTFGGGMGLESAVGVAGTGDGRWRMAGAVQPLA